MFKVGDIVKSMANVYRYRVLEVAPITKLIRVEIVDGDAVDDWIVREWYPDATFRLENDTTPAPPHKDSMPPPADKVNFEEQSDRSKVSSFASSSKSEGREDKYPLGVSMRLRKIDNCSDREPFTEKTQELWMRESRKNGFQSERANNSSGVCFCKTAESSESQPAYGESERAHSSNGESAKETVTTERRGTSQKRFESGQSPGEFGTLGTESAGRSESFGSTCLGQRDTQPLRDGVNHPSHYTSHPSGIEAIQVTEHMNFCLGNAVKYIWRAGLKDGSEDLQDLKKAVWYIEREIARREKAK